MFQQAVEGYLVQAAILVQPLFWMWLYGSRFNFPEDYKSYFYLGASGFLMLVGVTGYEVGYYRTNLIVQYTVYTVVAVYLYNQRNSLKEAICLGFLTVYLNSYYWEAPLHLAALLSGEPLSNVVFQLWRLIPVPFLLRHYQLKEPAPAYLAIGLSFSVAVMFLNWFVFHTSFIRWVLFVFNRVVCLGLLVKVIIEAEVKV